MVWGPFSIVWGLAIAMVTAMLYKYKDRSDGFLFWTGILFDRNKRENNEIN